jgi:hypothetical protein
METIVPASCAPSGVSVRTASRERIMRRQPDADRAQTGVRIEKRLLKVCKALAALYDLSLAEFFEELVRGAFAGRPLLSDAALAQAGELMRIYGLQPGEHGPTALGASVLAPAPGEALAALSRPAGRSAAETPSTFGELSVETGAS